MAHQSLNSSLATPQRQTFPRSGFRMPEMMFSKVLLPEPEAPSNPTIAWSATLRLIFLSTSSGTPAFAKLLLMPSKRIAKEARSTAVGVSRVKPTLSGKSTISIVTHRIFQFSCIPSLRFGVLLPAKEIIFQRPQHSHFNRGHHDDQGQSPGKHLIGSDQVRRLAQTITDAARRTDRFGDQRDAPPEPDCETGSGDKIR